MSQDGKPTQGGVRAPADFNPRQDPPLDFPDAEYGALSAGDYAALGFMSGLEVHQQLLTSSKLFCRCPAGRYVDVYDAEVLRHMRPTLSELGEYDGTALMEFKTKKEIVYQLERGSVCTYEMDDTPPFVIDDEAVRMAVEVALLLNLNLVSELHVMRKQYLDGSIPTGFQRTAMVGLSGAIPFEVPELGVKRELRIRQLSLEEDSCREISDVGHRITFRTDRLGMPLTEAVTEPDLLTPLEVQAAGRLLASVAQATGRVRRGPGAARQDVNVSVAGGRRIELKGVDNHRSLPELVHVEAFRQLNLLRIRAELRRRGVTAEMLALPAEGLPWEVSPLVVDAGPASQPCDFAPIHDALDRGEKVIAVSLPGFGGLLNHRTQPGVTFAREFADRVRVIACPVHRPFMLHSDLRDYGLDPRQWRNLRVQLKAEEGDAVMVVWAPEADAATAARELLIRAQDAVKGIHAETRQAFRDGTNGFERILPGPDRMYPDTDTPPLPIADETVIAIRERLPESPWSRARRYERQGLDPRAARRLVTAPWADLFDAVEPAPGAIARRIAAAMEKRLPYHHRAGVVDLPNADRLRPLVRAVEAGEILPEATERILDSLIEESDVDAESALAPYRRRSDDLEELERVLEELASRASGLVNRPIDVLLRWAMGGVMPRFIGRLDPAVVRERVIETLQGSVTEIGT
ncbi:MAG: Glu-tRNA(Gln) amidotransferase subunit GatE [Gemmatimonadota bacterium]|nr:MAG: Glu-tRNA(Gln) amidotransferase subunit GatE [Gemmatimonadota bacterium]